MYVSESTTRQCELIESGGAAPRTRARGNARSLGRLSSGRTKSAKATSIADEPMTAPGKRKTRALQSHPPVTTASHPISDDPCQSRVHEVHERSVWDDVPGAFHFLSVSPPLAIVGVCLPLQSALKWYPIWYATRTFLPAVPASLGGHAIAVYAAYASFEDVAWFGSDANLLAAAVSVGVVLGVAFRNATNAWRWLVGLGAGTPGRASAAPLVPARSPSVLVAVPVTARSAGGAGEFTVKVLLPTAKFSQGMVYNEKKSLQAFVDLEDASQPAMATLVRLIAREGGGGGVKGYFAARREGEALRIYVDRILPEPARPW